MVVQPFHIGRLLCSIGATSRSIFTNVDVYMYTQHTGQVRCACAREAECQKQCRNADDGQITVVVNICPLLLLFAMTTGQHAFYILV